MSGRKTFTAGEVLQAADVNDYLMDQSVMVFAGTAARGSAIPSPTEGMVTYRSDDDAVEVYDGSSWNAVGAGKILQVVSTTKTDKFSVTSATYTDLTGLSATITPAASANKILIFVSVSMNQQSNVVSGYQLLRDSTVIGSGTAVGNREAALASFFTNSTFPAAKLSSEFLDSPSSTSSLTYKIQVRCTSGVLNVNTSGDDGDVASNLRTSSTITLMEVAG